MTPTLTLRNSISEALAPTLRRMQYTHHVLFTCYSVGSSLGYTYGVHRCIMNTHMWSYESHYLLNWCDYVASCSSAPGSQPSCAHVHHDEDAVNRDDHSARCINKEIALWCPYSLIYMLLYTPSTPLFWLRFYHNDQLALSGLRRSLLPTGGTSTYISSSFSSSDFSLSEPSVCLTSLNF